MNEDETDSMEGAPLPAEKRDDGETAALIRDRAVIAQAAQDTNHRLSQHDVRFVEGENQWPDAIRADAEAQGNPCLTLNDLPVFVERVCGDQRMNRPAIHVHAADDYGAQLEFSDGKSSRRIKGASIYEGIIRAIEFNSQAEAHYDRAYQHAVDGAVGWLRVLTRYANGRDFDQELVIRSIKNRWSALLADDAQEPDRSDASYGFIGSEMLRREFDRRYPKARQGDLIDAAMSGSRAYWGPSGEDRIKVAEYFTREAMTRELVLFSNGQTDYLDAVKDLLQGGALMDASTGHPMAVEGQDGQPIPVQVVRSRKVTTWCVYWRKVTAWDTLEGPLKLPFSTIPLVPVIGRERDMPDGETRNASLIRHVKDAQQMQNYWMSKATQRVALAPLAQWFGPESAFEGREAMWRQANSAAQAFLVYNEDASSPPSRVAPPDMPVAEVQIASQMAQAKKAVLGMYDGALDLPQQTSGRAINARDRQAQSSNVGFGDNLNRAIRRIGLLLVEAIPKIYDTERVMRLRNEDGTGDWIKVNQVVTGPDGQEHVINPLGSGEYDVTVTAGPSYATQRAEAGDGQMQLLQTAPDLMPVIGDVVVENQDWPQAEKLATRIRKSMDPKLLTSAEREAIAEDDPQQQGGPQSPEDQAAAQQQQMAQQVLEAQHQVAMAQADADMAEAEAKKAKAAADIQEAQMRMAAMGLGGQAPQLPVVGSAPAGNNQQQVTA